LLFLSPFPRNRRKKKKGQNCSRNFPKSVYPVFESRAKFKNISPPAPGNNQYPNRKRHPRAARPAPRHPWLVAKQNMRYWQPASCRPSAPGHAALRPITDVLFTWRPATRKTRGHTFIVIRYFALPSRHGRLTRPARRPWRAGFRLNTRAVCPLRGHTARTLIQNSAARREPLIPFIKPGSKK
jgi:hypothetical protein